MQRGGLEVFKDHRTIEMYKIGLIQKGMSRRGLSCPLLPLSLFEKSLSRVREPGKWGGLWFRKYKISSTHYFGTGGRKFHKLLFPSLAQQAFNQPIKNVFPNQLSEVATSLYLMVGPVQTLLFVVH